MYILLGREQRCLEDPVKIIRCHQLSEMTDAFELMEESLAKGLYLAGFLSYEAGYAFEKKLFTGKKYDFPLFSFGAFKNLSRRKKPADIKKFKLVSSGVNISKKEYFRSFGRVRGFLEDGLSYQINYTFKQKFWFDGDHLSLYDRLQSKQPAAYSALVLDKDLCVLSLSPELFFAKKGGLLKVKPMKGTLAYKPGLGKKLWGDRKNRSENIMIVDLLRSDLGRIARILYAPSGARVARGSMNHNRQGHSPQRQIGR